MKQLSYVISNESNPYHNLALEEWLLHSVEEEQCILYLWQNARTVVIGRNQNPWKECKIDELETDGGYLVRRLSGGGAVFHDLGNLNFTFLVHKKHYNVEKQVEVILRAVKLLGIQGEKSGRNDITVDGMKFSGNAFYQEHNHCYHHGTILVSVDMTMLSHYLNVSKDKLVTKGVDSIRARVTNLTEHQPSITIDKMKESLIKAFGELYGGSPEELILTEEDFMEMGKSREKFVSFEWRFGKEIRFTDSFNKRFSWGDIEVHSLVAEGRIQECKIYSDSLDTKLVPSLMEGLKDVPYRYEDMKLAVDEVINNIEYGAEFSSMKEDIISLIRENL